MRLNVQGIDADSIASVRVLIFTLSDEPYGKFPLNYSYSMIPPFDSCIAACFPQSGIVIPIYNCFDFASSTTPYDQLLFFVFLSFLFFFFGFEREAMWCR